MDRSQMVGSLAVATGGCAALLSLTTARGFVGRDASLGEVVVHAPETAAAVGIVVAILAATLTAGRGVAAAAVAAVGLVGIAVTVDSSLQSWPAAWTTAALGGLAIGGLTGWASDHTVIPALVAGAVVGATLSFPLRHPLVLVVDGPSPGFSVDTRSVGIAVAVIALVCLVAATRAVRSATPELVTPSGTTVAVCLGITAVAWALGIWFEYAQPIKGWYWGWLLVPAVIVGAVALRRRGGATVLVVALGWAVIHSVDLSWLPDLPWLLVLVPLAVVGVVVGQRVTRPEVLVALLIPGAVTWLITGEPMSRAFSVLALFVVPVLIVAAFTSEVRSRPVSPGVLATALTAVALWETSPRAVIVEIFATRIGNDTASFAVNPFLPQTLPLAAEYVVPAILTLTVCVAALWVLRRRGSDA